MSVIVTEAGFAPEDWTGGFVSLSDIALHQGAVDLSNADDPAALAPHLAGLRLVRIAFPAFSDGRAFTIARRLRGLGYAGRLRAHGPVIADQWAMLRRTGFTEAEIPDDLAARQPWEQWRFRDAGRAQDYQARLRA
jgi:uncharacterized protein (DUF934 family)